MSKLAKSQTAQSASPKCEANCQVCALEQMALQGLDGSPSSRRGGLSQIVFEMIASRCPYIATVSA